ncbi:hypothetical protein DSECCO2_120460 [anaerobic digester metagenome]
MDEKQKFELLHRIHVADCVMDLEIIYYTMMYDMDETVIRNEDGKILFCSDDITTLLDVIRFKRSMLTQIQKN